MPRIQRFRCKFCMFMQNFLELMIFSCKIKRIVAEVTIDQTHHSLCFNEYLTLISNNRRAQPSEENLIDAFGLVTLQKSMLKDFCYSNFDTGNTGKISMQMFIQILKTKEVPERDIQEMLEGNSSCVFNPFSLSMMLQLTKK